MGILRKMWDKIWELLELWEIWDRWTPCQKLIYPPPTLEGK